MNPELNSLPVPPSAHEVGVADYYTHETALYVHSWHAEHFHFGIFEPGEVRTSDQHPTQVQALPVALQRMVDRIIGPASIDGQSHVVDAGCGVGGTAFSIAKRFGARVTGVNICKYQLEIARRRAATRSDQRVDFVFADCSQELPFADDSVSVIVNVESACHYSDRARFVAECHRVLKPGGMLVAMDWVAADGMSPDRYDAVIAPACHAWFIASLESPTSYRNKLIDTGFEVLEEETLGQEVRPNAELFARGAEQLRAAQRHAALEPPQERLLRQFALLSRAWLDGDFALHRYAARKPTCAGL